MADLKTPRTSRLAQLLSRSVLTSPGLLILIAAPQAHAQQRVVSACSGVSLPSSVVTDIAAPVVTGITGPTEAAINGILVAPLLGALLPPLSLDATGLLNQAASGSPITLQALATDGTVVGPADQCRVTSDSITLDTPAGVAIGGNQITGLGANGVAAFASDIDAIALGNNARTEAGATGSIALGANSSVAAVNSVALGAGSVAARGALPGYAASGLAGPQSSAGEVSVGAPGALRQLTNVAAGTAATDAATVGQVDGVIARLAGLGTAAVQYDGAARDRATLAGAAGTTIANVAPGALTATSTEAVNGAQLYATGQAVGANTTAIVGLDARVTTNTTAITNLSAAVASQPLRYAQAATPTTPNGGVVSDDTTLVGASGGPVGLHNVRAGVLLAGSTDAVNGDQLAATNTQVAANATAITNLNTLVVGSTVSPIQYSNAATPTLPNGGTRTNDVTLVGADAAAPVGLHNVAGGSVAAGSTDAVNGQQLFAVATTASNGVQYDRDAAGARTNTVTLAGGNAAAPVTLANVAAGTVAAGSTQAVNGGQLYATDQIARQAAASGANSVQYDAGGASVSFNRGGNTLVALRNVAPGTSTTDAVNVGQLQGGVQSAVAQAAAYTDARVSSALATIDFDLRRVRRDIGAGTAAAMAAAGLPQASEPGRSMIAVGGGTYRGQSAIAFGASTFLKDEHSILRIGATYDSRGYGGANASYGYQF